MPASNTTITSLGTTGRLAREGERARFAVPPPGGGVALLNLMPYFQVLQTAAQTWSAVCPAPLRGRGGRGSSLFWVLAPSPLGGGGRGSERTWGANCNKLWPRRNLGGVLSRPWSTTEVSSSGSRRPD